MTAFSRYHPIVNFVYFTVVLLFAMLLRHPVCLAVAVVSGAWYCRRSARRQLPLILVLMVLAAVTNPLFNHQGATILAYFPSGNPLTLESVLFGVSGGVMLAAVMTWSICLGAVFTGDKLLYLFGRVTPALSLVLSMILRFVPQFRAQLQTLAQTQQCAGRSIHSGSLRARMRCAVTLLSMMVTWSLEHAIDTADSMKSRGYGLPGRTAFSIFTFEWRDGMLLAWILTVSGMVLIAVLRGDLSFHYFPMLHGTGSATLYAAYGALFVTPAAIDLWEAHQWNAIKSKT